MGPIKILLNGEVSMENQSILFQAISGEKEADPMVRKAFRVPVPDSASVQVFLGEKEFSLLNVSHGGICVLCDEALDVECDEMLSGWKLRLEENHLHNLTGRVVHCSSTTSGQLLYGIQWVDLGEEQIDVLSKAVSQLKIKAFENNDRNIIPAQEVEK